MLIKKVISLARLVKNDYEDELWILLIISALGLLAMAGISQWQADDIPDAQPQARTMQTPAKASKQISLAQVQMIVAKPMADLIAMQVYDDENHVQNAYELVAQGSNSTSLQHGKNQHNTNRQSARLYLTDVNLFAVHAYIEDEINFKI